jgi:hypothetical protein
VLDPGIGNWYYYFIGLPILLWFLIFFSIRRGGPITVNGKPVMLK